MHSFAQLKAQTVGCWNQPYKLVWIQCDFVTYWVSLRAI